MTMLRLSLRCYGQLAGWMASLGVVVALLGCGASEGPTPAVSESSARAAAATTRTSGVVPEPVAGTGLIADGVNTDQSIPEHVTFGPTGSLPAGAKQMGH